MAVGRGLGGFIIVVGVGRGMFKGEGCDCCDCCEGVVGVGSGLID